MYGNKLATAIKVDNKVLRENGEQVYIPFGSEYSIMIKNMNSVRVLANIEIDGRNVIPGGLVVNAGQTVNIERFVDNLNAGNRFKFIEKTQQISDYRGDRIDDGLIRITYQFEKELPVFDNSLYRGITKKMIAKKHTFDDVSYNVQSAPCNVSTSGITVEGSISTQQFTQVNNFQLEFECYSMIIQLVGDVNGKIIEHPITVKTKHKCDTCGTFSKGFAKFCSNCGASLEQIT